jgi:hypothetical protein
MLWVFILFSRPPRETKSFQAAITNTHSLNLAISPFFFFVFFSPSAKSIKERGGRLGKRKIRKTSSLHRKEENPIKKNKKLYSFFELSAWNTRRKSVSVVGGSAGGIFFFFPL